MSRPVYPIPPSFKDSKLELESTYHYVDYLKKQGATRILSTAGTSQFNLLSLDEIYDFNTCIAEGFEGEVILGLPELSLYHLKQEIEKLNQHNYLNIKLLILFPERYYNDSQIIRFFKEVCNVSNYGIYLHGNPLKRGNGGVYEYSNSILKSLSDISNFEGIKEEYSSLDVSMKNIRNLDLDIIVAGGSMRRFWSLEPYGATSFLTGVGSFNPWYSERFYDSYLSKEYDICRSIIQNIEAPFFETFMSIGWHACMREALKQLGYILENRKPFTILTKEEVDRISLALTKIIK